MPYIVITYAGDRRTAESIIEAAPRYGARPVGLYRFPSSKNVDCPGWRCPEVTNKRYGYAHHLTQGHTVHGACQRRETGWRAKIATTLMGLLGYNLLPRDFTPRIFQNPAGHEPVESDVLR